MAKARRALDLQALVTNFEFLLYKKCFYCQLALYATLKSLLSRRYV